MVWDPSGERLAVLMKGKEQREWAFSLSWRKLALNSQVCLPLPTVLALKACTTMPAREGLPLSGPAFCNFASKFR